jgi:hypothetical protein
VIKADVFVRARTSDGAWAAINALDLDERSFRQLILNRLAEAGLFAQLRTEGEAEPLTTALTKEQVEAKLNDYLPNKALGPATSPASDESTSRKGT